MVLEVGMADTGRLILFSSVYLFLPPFILIPSPGRCQLKCLRCRDVSFPLRRGCWAWFGCGLFLARKGRAAGQKSCACHWVRVRMSLQRYPIGVTHVLWAQPLFHRNSKALRPCQRGLSSSVRTCASPGL